MRGLPRLCVVRGSQGATPRDDQSCLGMEKSLSSTHMHALPRICVEKNENDLRMNDILRDLCMPGARWVMHDDGRPHFLRRTDLQPMTRGWYEFLTRSIMPTTNRSEVNTERAMLVLSIIIGEDIQVDEIIAEQIYKLSNKNGIRSKLPFPGVIQRLYNEAKASIPKDTMIPIEPPIDGKVMAIVRGERTATRQAPLPELEEEEETAEIPQAPQFQQSFPPNFMESLNSAMAEMQLQSNKRWDALKQRLVAAQEEN
ncbi:hypothetical protein PIB30_089765 [Stylosanthes scabra]|uniref:Putative plant transposon protein domain-containing protein n=1 Tax=Stylosanthes scabra TaxID=79078 RepID=A0ABU6WSI5_9FABA|nr:hypothetical protein [Stylosanthes scabra]